MHDVSTAITLKTNRPLASGLYSIQLRVTFRRKQKYYSSKYSMTEADFEKMNSQRPGKKLKKVLLALQALEQRAYDIINQLPDFNFPEFERQLLQNTPVKDVFSAYDAAIERLTREGRVGTADSYESARSSLWNYSHGKTFTKKKGVSKKEIATLKEAMKEFTPLPFSFITPHFLKEYEQWMLTGGRSMTTIGMYLRTLKTLFNDVIDKGDISPKLYPFGKRKYQIPSSVNIKKALPLADIEKIFTYQPATQSEARSRDLWIFTYLCNGINVKDLARLQYKQVGIETISFIRAKTERATRQQLKTITAAVTPEVSQIIEKWGNQPAEPDAFVFPILSTDLTAKQELAKVRQATKTINYYIGRIAAAVGIEKHVTTYTARHSFSTVLKRAGVSTAFIAESLGHTSEKTTQNYLDSFETDAKRLIISKLTAFEHPQNSSN